MSRHLVFATLVWALPAFAACGTDSAEPSDVEVSTASVDQAGSVCGPVTMETLTIKDLGKMLWMGGTLKGLAPEDVKITMKAKAVATAECTNPGGKVPPGKDPVSAGTVYVTGSAWISKSNINSCMASFSMTTEDPPTLVPGAPDCPNPNWTENIIDLQFIKFTLTVWQSGKIVMIKSCTFKQPTHNGPLSPDDCSCTDP